MTTLDDVTLDEKTLERRAWSRVFDDGIWDLYLGVVFLNVVAWMTAAVLDWGYAETAVPAILVLFAAVYLFRLGKRRITQPRLGYFEIERRRTAKVRLAGALAVGVTALMVAFTVGGQAGAFPDGVPAELILFGVLGFKFLLLFSLAGYLMGVSRFYTYGLLGAFGLLGAEVLVAEAHWARGWDVVGLFGLPALVMLPTGLVLLARFLRAYPLREADGAA